MTHHQQNHSDRLFHASQLINATQTCSGSAILPPGGEDELAMDVDEPPDSRHPSSQFLKSHIERKSAPRESLLTRALHISTQEEEDDKHSLKPPISLSPMSSCLSVASTAELTSDGGMTSPELTHSPSPPYPAPNFARISYHSPSPPYPAPNFARISYHSPKPTKLSPSMFLGNDKTPTVAIGPTVVAPQPEQVRKRCITFACGGKNSPSKAADGNAGKPKEAAIPDAPRKPSILRFACPSRTTENVGANTQDKHTSRPQIRKLPASPPPNVRRVIISGSAAPKDILATPTANRSSDGSSKKMSRFHEFASSVEEEDEWIQDSTVHLDKMTVNCTLAKERAIRKLAEEAEEEALQDEEEERLDAEKDDEGDEDDDDEDDANSHFSDGGNETDDEEGFADSDEESDGESSSMYRFWVPSKESATAISSEHMDLMAPMAHRNTSESSIELANSYAEASGKPRKGSRRIKIRPGTPDLPDSTDFVCGTLDEDRPLEDAYVSCMEERKRLKHIPVPQDIDPTFPTSDPEDEDEDEEEGEEEADSDNHIWLKGQLDSVDDGPAHPWLKKPKQNIPSVPTSPSRRAKSPLPPPTTTRRARSPPPPARRNRSPLPRRPSDQPPKRLRSPPPPLRSVQNESPHLTPRPQPTDGMTAETIHNMVVLAKRPGLTHTKSLPRSPAVFSHPFALGIATASDEQFDTNSLVSNGRHTRGAIDIVKGLERKRQRCREKLMIKHCQRAGNGKIPQRRPQPGKGAERMRELGLEMAGKGKGGANARPVYVLSV
ncbi:MAG: hypothetical protein M1829_003652 [Trizodia sp. TS-e1964]|nr:MAG: hypothetical protein M1829_003652 [Trizodia sp. TS-e1964]